VPQPAVGITILRFIALFYGNLASYAVQNEQNSARAEADGQRNETVVTPQSSL